MVVRPRRRRRALLMVADEWHSHRRRPGGAANLYISSTERIARLLFSVKIVQNPFITLQSFSNNSTKVRLVNLSVSPTLLSSRQQ